MIFDTSCLVHFHVPEITSKILFLTQLTNELSFLASLSHVPLSFKGKVVGRCLVEGYEDCTLDVFVAA